MGGAAAGGFATEPLPARVPARRLLLASCAGASLALGAWIVVGTSLAAPLLLAALGATSAQPYTLAQAEAYARLPGRPGLVNALLGRCTGRTWRRRSPWSGCSR